LQDFLLLPKTLFISIKAQIFSIYLIIYHLFKHFAQAQLKSAMLIKQVKLGFTRACRSIEELGKKWLKTR
jgi:hypothetical protein